MVNKCEKECVSFFPTLAASWRPLSNKEKGNKWHRALSHRRRCLLEKLKTLTPGLEYTLIHDEAGYMDTITTASYHGKTLTNKDEAKNWELLTSRADRPE